MDEALLAAYRATDYRVRLPLGGWATIRIDAPLPEPLLARVGARPWAFITAWNPRSKLATRADNRHAQRTLLAALWAQPDTMAILPGCGAGAGGWREPSLFVIGTEPASLDTLARQHAQHAYVHGRARDPARLRLLTR